MIVVSIANDTGQRFRRRPVGSVPQPFTRLANLLRRPTKLIRQGLDQFRFEFPRRDQLDSARFHLLQGERLAYRRRPRRRYRHWYRRQCGSLCGRALLGTPLAHFPHGGNDVRFGQPSFLRLRPPVRVHAVPPLRALVLPKRFTNQFTHGAVLFPRYLFRTCKHFRGKRDGERLGRPHGFIVSQCLARLRMIASSSKFLLAFYYYRVVESANR